MLVPYPWIALTHAWTPSASVTDILLALRNTGVPLAEAPRIRIRDALGEMGFPECSDGLEVIEISAPAEHRTLADHEMTLPGERIDPEQVTLDIDRRNNEWSK